jgi:hypothetical protein
MDLKTVVVYPVWEAECPGCHQTLYLDAEVLEGKNKTQTKCIYCKEEFKVERAECLEGE